MCISFAVMLPVGNPPNAIVFSYGHCQIKDMVSRGWPLPTRPTCHKDRDDWPYIAFYSLLFYKQYP